MYIRIKRFLDIIFSVIALVILLPIILLIAILIKIDLGSPILFRQERIGKDNKVFTIYKFRTMIDKKESNSYSDVDRLTKLGLMLRKLSLDELPQLINIINGDMAFIGPRPLVKQYLNYYTHEELKRHIVRPGLTGLAQVSGRSNVNWDERFKLDVEYVENISFKLDVMVFFKTVRQVFLTSDIKIRGKNDLIDFDLYRKQNNNKI